MRKRHLKYDYVDWWDGLKAIIRKQGLTPAQAVEKAGFAQSRSWDFTSGTIKFTVGYIAGIMRELGVTIEALEAEVGKRIPEPQRRELRHELLRPAVNELIDALLSDATMAPAVADMILNRRIANITIQSTSGAVIAIQPPNGKSA